jgi:hypothetical protein
MARPREKKKKENSARQMNLNFLFRKVLVTGKSKGKSPLTVISALFVRCNAMMVSADAMAVSDAAKTELDGQNTDHLLSVTEEDDRDLLKLGYRAVLARGWGTFDNFACSFSALYCIGGIRVLFYIALSNGGPAAL